MATVDYQPWYVGATYASWTFTLNAGGSPDNITGATNWTLIFRTLNGADTAGTGTFTVITSNPAVISYKPSTADVAAAFSGYVIITAYFPPSNSTADKVVYDPIPFTLTAD